MRFKKRLLLKVKDFIEEHNLLPMGAKVVVAVSGGPDSMALLFLLKELEKEFDLKLFVAHFDHSTRGKESLEDALFVADMCGKLGICALIKRVNVPELHKEKRGMSFEELARILRYEFFDYVRNYYSAELVATAHTADDQVETVLHNIIRGTGLDGLHGILPKRDHFIRPLLSVTKSELLEYLKQEGIPYKVDYTNEKTIYTRNKIRHLLIPFIEENFNPSFKESILRLSKIAIDFKDYIEPEVKKSLDLVCKNSDYGPVVLKERYCLLPRFLRISILKQLLSLFLFPTQDSERLYALDRFILKNDKGILEIRGGYVYADKTVLFTKEKLTAPETLIVDFKHLIEQKQIDLNFGKWKISFNIIYGFKGDAEDTIKRFEDKEKVFLYTDIDKLEKIYIKAGYEGLNLFVKGKKVPLKELFRQKNIPVWERKIYPLLFFDSKLKYVPFLGVVSEDFDDNRHRVCIKVKVKRPCVMMGLN